MKRLLLVVFAIVASFFLGCKGSGANSIKIDGMYAYLEEGGFNTYVYKVCNISNKTIKAFSAKITYYDEFDKVVFSKIVKMSSEMLFIDENRNESKFSGLKPGETIFIHHTSGRVNQDYVTNEKTVLKYLEKEFLIRFTTREGIKYKVEFDKVLFAD